MTRIHALLLLAGCNQLFGLDETDLIEDRGLVTGEYKLRWVENRADGTPLVQDGTYGLDELQASVELDDGTTRDVTLRADGTFSFTTATVGQRYSLTFRSTYARRTYQHDATELVLVDRIAGRVDRQLVPAGTQIDLQLTNRPVSATATEEIQSTGIWTRRTVTELPQLIFDWNTAIGIEPLGLLDAARHDEAYYINYDTTSTFMRIFWAARVAITLIGGQTTAATATAEMVPPNSCTRIVWGARQEVARIEGLIDDELAALALWAIIATPEHAMGAAGAKLPVAYSSSSVADVDVDLAVDYGSPFPGGTRDAEAALVVYRSGPAWITLGFSVPVEPGCTTPTILPVGTTTIPLAVRLAGTELASDDQIVAIDRSASIPVTWQTSPSGTHDDTQLALYEIVSTTPLVSRLVTTIYTTAATALIDPADLVAGRSYLIILSLRGGLPGASTGDYDRIDPLLPAGSLQTRAFRVQ